MDKIQRPNDMPFISEEISVEQFFHDALATKQIITYENSSVEELAKHVGCSADVVAELEAVCNPEKLLCGLEDEDDPLSGRIPPTNELVTLNIQRQELSKRNLLSYRQMQTNLLKYRRINFRVSDSFAGGAWKEPLYVPDDVLLTVVLMRPYNRPLDSHELRLGRLMLMDSCFLVLGRQKLVELKDKITCLADFAVADDHSHNPSISTVVSGDVYKSGFFYINGTFYNDLREPSCQDLSAGIIEWASKGSRNGELGPFTSQSMSDACFKDLRLRLGQPYLYMHQGKCEHIMVFTDVRLLHADDCQKADHYPIQISQSIKRRYACMGCKLYTARWVTYNNSRMPFEPGFFCETCFKAFNYEADSGQKIGDFEAVPYFDRQALPN